jgi:hypothetical protein
MTELERFNREVAAHLIRRARRDHPGRTPWMTCVAAACSPARAGDEGALKAIRGVAIKFAMGVAE